MQELIKKINGYLINRYNPIYKNFKDNIRDYVKLPQEIMNFFEDHSELKTLEEIEKYNEIIHKINKDNSEFIGDGEDNSSTYIWLTKVSSSQITILGNNLKISLEQDPTRVTLYNVILQIFMENIKAFNEIYAKQTNEELLKKFKNISKTIEKICEYDIQTALEKLNVDIMDLYMGIHNILINGINSGNNQEIELKFIQNITELRYLLGYLSAILIYNAVDLNLIQEDVALTLSKFNDWLNIF